MKKTITMIIGGIIAIIIILIVLINLYGNSMVKAGIETGGTKALGVGVNVGNVSLGILRGKLGIGDLIIRNPAGYANENLLELGKGNVEVVIGSLLSDTVDIKQIDLDGVNLTIEQKGSTNNLKQIMDSMPKGESKAEGEKGGKKLKIDKLEIKNINVKVKLLPIPGKSDNVELSIPSIVMTDLGGDKKTDTGELTKKIMAAITEKITQVGVGVLPQEMIGSLEAGQKLLEEGLKGTTGEIGKTIEEATKGNKDILGGLKGILKKPTDSNK